jgi:hypothetical protein
VEFKDFSITYGVSVHKGHHTFFEANTQNFILKLQIHSNTEVMIRLTHFTKDLVQLNMSAGLNPIYYHNVIFVDPINESIMSVWVSENPVSFKNGIECLLGI